MKQQILAMAVDQNAECKRYRRPTRRDQFLATMEQVVPWVDLCAVIEPYYPKAGNGRPPVGPQRMLRMYFIEHWFSPSDEGWEDALLDSPALRRFVGIDPGVDRVPDATTLLEFRRLIEDKGLGTALFAKVGEVLHAQGLKVGTGTIVDATIIAAPSSTMNAKGERDPEIHQTRKGKQWHYGMKLHIGVDSKTGLAHSAVVTAANVHDKHPLPQLLHGAEKDLYGDSAYASQQALIQSKAPHAQDRTNQRIRPSSATVELDRILNRAKSKVRSRVEHVFAVVKKLWGFGKVRDRGLAKNATRAFVAPGRANIYWSDTVRDTVGRKDLVSAFARGPLFELPAGSVDAIVGAEAAEDRYSSIAPGERLVNSRRSAAAYAELRVPLWAGMSDGRRDGSQAALTLATRRDRYSDFGSAGTYQAGLELRPSRTLLLRASAATSFKPPTLLQTSVPQTISPTQNPGFTDPRRNNEPIIDGDWVRTTNKDLQPENGKAYALGAVWEPGGESGLRLAGTAWRVRIDDLIGLLSSQVVIDNETLFPGWVTRAPASGGLPGRITRVLFMESNFGYVETGGFDFEVTQSWQSSSGRWSIGASATRTTTYDVVIVPGAPVASRLGRRFLAEYWSPTWKGRLTAGLDRGTWSLGIASRHVAAYKDSGSSDRVLGGGWVHDLSGRLDLKRLGLNLGAAKAAALSVSIVNAGNKLPEYAGSSPYYDTAQADWRGRYASIRLSVDW